MPTPVLDPWGHTVGPFPVPATIPLDGIWSGHGSSLLSLLDASEFTEGTAVWVASVGRYYRLARFSALATSGVGDTMVVDAAGFVGGQWISETTKNLSWEARAAWYIDPSLGNDENDGGTAGSGLALKTRSEFAARTLGMALTKNISITIYGSLGATDLIMPDFSAGRSSSSGFGFVVRYIGVPSLLFSGVVTGYTARNGATAQPTLMTIASLPVSWTVSGLIGKVVEYSDGIGGLIRGVVVSEPSAKTAWISPPINQLDVQGQVFAIGQTVSVWDMPSLGSTVSEVVEATADTKYSYLSSPKWIMSPNIRCSMTNCYGPVTQYGGVCNKENCFSGGVDFVIGGTMGIYGGVNNVVVGGGGYVRFNAHSTVYGTTGLSAEGASVITAPGSTIGTQADIEYLGGTTFAASTATTAQGLAGGKISLNGYCYGTLSSGTTVLSFGSRDGMISLGAIPSFAGATGINFSLDAVTASTATLSSASIKDTNGNKAIGPAGDV